MRALGIQPLSTPSQTPPPPEKATAADGTHPTGMHSCFFLFFCFDTTKPLMPILPVREKLEYINGIETGLWSQSHMKLVLW